VNYTYDSIGELLTATGFESGGSSRLNEQLKYNYDAAGNLAIKGSVPDFMIFMS